MLTLSATAGACHSNTVPHLLSPRINTEAFHFNTDYPSLILPSFRHHYSAFLVACFLYFSHFLICISVFLLFLSPSYQRQAKYTENKLKAIKARNEYLLALEATNSCIFKYYIHDLSDIIDVSINTPWYSAICVYLVSLLFNLRLPLGWSFHIYW